MQRRRFLLSGAAVAAATLPGCGGGTNEAVTAEAVVRRVGYKLVADSTRW